MMVNLHKLLLICILIKPASADPVDNALEVARELNQKKADYFTSHFMEAKGLKLKSVRFKYQGEYIAFQYKRWKIKEESICADKKQNFDLFSQCTHQASKMFKWLCRDYGNDSSNPRVKLGKKMYCETARNYLPAKMEISKLDNQSKLDEARTNCSVKTLEYISQNSECERYQEILNSSEELY